LAESSGVELDIASYAFVAQHDRNQGGFALFSEYERFVFVELTGVVRSSPQEAPWDTNLNE